MARLPSTFRRSRAPVWMNTIAVGFALASLVQAMVARQGSDPDALFVIAASPADSWSAVVLGVLWAAALRRKPIYALLAAPLFAAVACIAAFSVPAIWWPGHDLFVFAYDAPWHFPGTWLPYAVAAIVIYALPARYAARRANGVVPADRGELLMGGASLVASAIGALLSWLNHDTFQVDPRIPWLFDGAYAAIGAALALGAVATAAVRSLRRKRFVARVERGDDARYRIDVTREGRRLVRVGAGATYRSIDGDEDVFDLEPEQEAFFTKTKATRLSPS